MIFVRFIQAPNINLFGNFVGIFKRFTMFIFVNMCSTDFPILGLAWDIRFRIKTKCGALYINLGLVVLTDTEAAELRYIPTHFMTLKPMSLHHCLVSHQYRSQRPTRSVIQPAGPRACVL